MKAVVFKAREFVLEDITILEPLEYEVRIRVKALGFNPSDYQFRQELEKTNGTAILGGEVAGEIDKVGSKVNHFKEGDKVFAYLPRKRSAYAEYVIVESDFVALMPASLSFEQAATLPVVGLTAYQCLVQKVKVAPNDAVFIAGGAGGVGSMALQLAKMQGAKTIVTTAGSERSIEYLQNVLELSAEQILNYKGLSGKELVTKAKELNNGNFYSVTLDCVGGLMTRLCCDLVNFEGDVISIVEGPRDSAQADGGDEDALFNKSATFHFALLYAKAKFGKPSDWVIYGEQLRELSRLIETQQLQTLQVKVLGSLSVETVKGAHALLESGHVKGKLAAFVP
jgi:NADPH:quinone reductase